MPDPFTVLGVPARFALPMRDVEQRHRDLSRALHPDRHAKGSPAERRVAIERAMAVNEAWRAVRDPLSRALALLELHGVAITEGERASPALLMEVMDLRESLEASRANPAGVEALREAVRAKIAAEEAVLASVFDGPEVSPEALQRARGAAVKLKYFRRFEEEADAMEP